jgi:transcriptional regulator with XRE-family HTH domain
VSEPDTRQGGLIAERLNRLWEARQPEGHPYTLREVADAINTQAGHALVSPQYLSVLRRGERTEPSFTILAALARFFGVTVDYFSADEETAVHSEAELRLLQALRDNGVRHLALCAADLNADDLATVIGIIHKFRIAEGLPEEPSRPDADR